MTEGNRLCPYCIKPMNYVGYGTVDKNELYHCEGCNIDVRIRELKQRDK